MKVMIAYPPLEGKGCPMLGQNRQFQWFRNPTYIYPMVPASAATLSKENGYEVIWADGIAERWSYEQFLNLVYRERPDLIVMETKTPVVKRHWRIIDELKGLFSSDPPQIVLVGDHVTALPEESMRNSQVDFILTGGDYDFLLLDLCRYLSSRGTGENAANSAAQRPENCGPRASQPALPPGIWYRHNGEIKDTGPFRLDHDLDFLPFIDRDLTKWQLYAYKNGNFKRTPGTYTMAGRDCWWGRCSFCSWTTLYPGQYHRARSPQKLLDEIGFLIENYGVKEIMDDSGTFPVGEWLRELCQGMIERGYNKKVTVDCNMRFGILTQEDYDLMAQAGFRFILFGLESANQETLDRINKSLRVEQIIEGAKMAKRAGLEPHITAMVGYPWESKAQAQRTIELAKDLFGKGYVDSLQATIVIPYPGTPLYYECDRNGWLKTRDWDRYDMGEGVMKSSLTDDEIKKLTQELYKAFASPQFILRKLVSMRRLEDLAFLWRAGTKVIGHLGDFGRKGTEHVS
ncbi:B12-binding domain-containing radical SAM protein [Candidatus Hakubella thermalkaliphila]|uniref:Radical SAM core domain-containing protein n=1 Tax=Candidatus Hakubella thermalkaliphila TaxID=2754717 RepID=A0A6V8QAY9_9ACTN|nr:radical SAM protein [Candidatus Hakubella thermalkaliphila]GFP27223.1 hypothetical protein HKBW3S33_00637 [Candidatus Hakubella thermalkaliphila]GFP41194.1 hypothetical protein HKBW3C_00320 [Candidatus Hakubella thermalkaliphila]